jgi:hypothetical protein
MHTNTYIHTYIQCEDNSVKALYRSGVALMHLGNYQRSTANLLKAHNLSPDDTAIARDLAKSIAMEKKQVNNEAYAA